MLGDTDFQSFEEQTVGAKCQCKALFRVGVSNESPSGNPPIHSVGVTNPPIHSVGVTNPPIH